MTSLNNFDLLLGIHRSSSGVVGQWLSSWLAEQEVRGSFPGLATTISEICYLLLQSHDMAERSLKSDLNP